MDAYDLSPRGSLFKIHTLSLFPPDLQSIVLSDSIMFELLSKGKLTFTESTFMFVFEFESVLSFMTISSLSTFI
ncbi:hypothetical protein BpHYR1_035087 [Brachionus plicatilis]|uniref:Uncharacterized protein n=1 Tax=Brachionus plicatilis TaxID=10195 RepID=A0A3M7SZI2_BRAPC|nr:hypothetical protein BpHYR1_035087 [Brachionus plicatilis]